MSSYFYSCAFGFIYVNARQQIISTEKVTVVFKKKLNKYLTIAIHIHTIYTGIITKIVEMDSGDLKTC